jgi:hypothetical protein
MSMKTFQLDHDVLRFIHSSSYLLQKLGGEGPIASTKPLNTMHNASLLPSMHHKSIYCCAH